MPLLPGRAEAPPPIATPVRVVHSIALRSAERPEAFRPEARPPSRSPRVFPEAAPAPPRPRLAIVFDDLGYTTSGLARELLELPVRLTFAVLPGLPATAAFARAARERGHEVLLHVPMEPLDRDRHDPGPDALLVDLTVAENLRRLREGLDGLTGYAGVSNHMGSRFTSRPDLLGPVLREIRRRGPRLFFLDSSTTPFSAVAGAAHEAGLPSIRNNVFLDGGGAAAGPPADRAAEAGAIALRQGSAVAIGHVRRDTVEAVRAAIAGWESAGIRLVPVSDLLQL